MMISLHHDSALRLAAVSILFGCSILLVSCGKSETPVPNRVQQGFTVEAPGTDSAVRTPGNPSEF